MTNQTNKIRVLVCSQARFSKTKVTNTRVLIPFTKSFIRYKIPGSLSKRRKISVTRSIIKSVINYTNPGVKRK